MQNTLYHHGILGQRWGVRRFQNKDGSLTPAGKTRYYVDPVKTIKTNRDGSKTVPSGFMFNRIGEATRDVNPSGATYVSYGKDDAARYVKFLGSTPIRRLLKISTHDTVQHIKVKENLKMASEEHVAKETAKLLLSNKRLLDGINNSLYASAVTGDLDATISQKHIQKALSNPMGKEGQKLSWGVSGILADPNFAEEAAIVCDHFRKQGYDVLPDVFDKLSGTSKNPMIILNPEKVEITSTTTITKDVMKDAKQYVRSLEKLKISDLLD